jgi:hypothetical protein
MQHRINNGRDNYLSDTVTLKVSKRKIYLAIGLIVIIVVVGFGGFLAYRYFTSPSLHIESFSTENEPQFSWYFNESDWGTDYSLNYKFSNQGWGTADSVTLVYAFYDSRGLVLNYKKDYGTVASNTQITGSASILINSYMQFTLPASFRIFLYQGNTLAGQSTLPYD